jgi:hypothetical protein
MGPRHNCTACGCYWGDLAVTGGYVTGTNVRVESFAEHLARLNREIIDLRRKLAAARRR